MFAQIDKLKAQKIKEGVDVISLGIGDPDLPTPDFIVDVLARAAQDPKNHQYPSYEGMLEFRKAVADWYKRRFNVTLDPETEVLTLIGSKEGIAHIFLAFVDPGDKTLVTDPGYPVYRIGTLLAGGEPVSVPGRKENNFLVDFEEIDPLVAKKSKLLFLNYPGNPTAAVADLSFFEQAVKFAETYDLLICHDAAYSEVSFDSHVCPSFLQAEGAKNVGIEFHSLSKTYNMTGWRIGFAVGNKEAISALGTVKTNVDSGVFGAVQVAGIAALNGPHEPLIKQNEIYKNRRDVVVETLNSLGWNIAPPKATFYVWAEAPKGYTSVAFASKLLNKTGVLVVPGVGYGDYGEGFFRISLTLSDNRLAEAMERIRSSGMRFA